jgi:hypothetical protein
MHIHISYIGMISAYSTIRKQSLNRNLEYNHHNPFPIYISQQAPPFYLRASLFPQSLYKIKMKLPPPCSSHITTSLRCSPQLCQPRFCLVVIRLRALRPTDVGVGIVHVTHISTSVRIRVWIHVSVALARWAGHVTR